MAKRKQTDYHKTKLKPGRTLPRGRNVTNTTFKAKKIVVQSQSYREKAELTIKDYIDKVNVGSTTSKASALKHLNAAILNEKDNLSLYLLDIFENVLKLILDVEPSLRKNTIQVLETVLQFTNDLQVSSFVSLLTKTLSTAMTSNLDMGIKQSSLKFFNVLMKTHPNLFCNSMAILTNLQGLLSSPAPYRKGKKTAKSTSKSSLAVSYGDSIYSQDWRMQVLAEMNLFLQEMLKNNCKNEDENDGDQQQVYWDCQSPLYLEIFAGGGLKPVDIEKYDSWNFSVRPNDLKDPIKVKNFLSELVNLLSMMFVEEITEGSIADDDLLSHKTIGNLCRIFQLLSHAGDWVKLLSNCENDLEMSFTHELKEKIFKKITKFPFHSRPSVFDLKSRPNQAQSCFRLNLSVCYLYSAFLLATNSDDDSIKFQTFSHLKTLSQMDYECKYESIPVIIKIVKIYLGLINPSTGKSNVIPVKIVYDLLLSMTTIFKVTDERANKNLLFLFLVNLSLQPEYKYLINIKAMKEWFKHLLKFLMERSEKNILDSMLMKNIKKIAARKHPHFLDVLEGLDVKKIEDLLHNGNETTRETVIFLIYNMRKITFELLSMCNSVILYDSSFTTKWSFMLIRLLTHRFKDPDVCSEDRINFIQFLVNTAIDSKCIFSKNWEDFNLSEFSEAFLPCKDVVAFSILPSIHWKKHSPIFEECFKSLNQLPISSVSLVIMAVYKELLENIKNLPIHSAIAMLRLTSSVMPNRTYECNKQDLIYSCLLFVSVFTTVVDENELYQWNAVEIMESMDFNRKFVRNLLVQLDFDSQVPKEGIVVHYLLRIIKFLFTKDLLLPEDTDKVLSILSNFKKYCKDKNIDKQTLYVKLAHFFTYYFAS